MKPDRAAIAACVLLASAGLALAQQPPAPEKQAAEAAQAPARAEKPRLNLRLDDPAKFAREEPAGDRGAGGDGLPALGRASGGSQRMPEVQPGRADPFPKDTNPTR